MPNRRRLNPPYYPTHQGTGRSLSLKLVDQLRRQSGESGGALSSSPEVKGSGKNKGREKIHEQRWKWESENMGANRMLSGGKGGRTLNEVSLETPIRYSAGDPVEQWLNNVLCLDTKASFHR